MDPSKPETDYAPFMIQALGPSMGEDLPDRFLCPVRALRYYLKLKHKGQDPNNRFRRLLCAFKLGHTGDISKQTVSGWIRQLIKQAYLNMASLADLTRKLAFLLTLASAKRNSEVWAFSADVRFGQDYNAATLSFLSSFLAKTMDPSKPETDYAPVMIPALGPSMGEDLPERFLCPVRALRYYLKLKHKGQDPNNWFRRLLCVFKLGHTGDISKQTVSGWIRQLIKQAYSEVQDEDIPHLTHTNFQAIELRALPLPWRFSRIIP